MDEKKLFAVKAQYIKDLSFENPGAPKSLIGGGETPAIDVNVNLRAQRLNDDLYELTQLISVKAANQTHTLFLIELAYGGIFQLSGIPKESVEAVMLIDAPFVLFPFARRVIADVTRDGGFPPLMLDPIDFKALFIQNSVKTEEK